MIIENAKTETHRENQRLKPIIDGPSAVGLKRLSVSKSTHIDSIKQTSPIYFLPFGIKGVTTQNTAGKTNKTIPIISFIR